MLIPQYHTGYDLTTKVTKDTKVVRYGFLCTDLGKTARACPDGVLSVALEAEF